MPKATKKKKEKQADFTKAKLKLGKGKKQASNATDTSFKARSIALPGQNPLARALAIGTEEPTTNQGLTLDEVLLRFRHPNSGVRKEAIGGLKDILQVGPEKEVGKVVRALGGIVSDDDATVRKALLSFLGWYLPALSQSILTPHLPLLLLQASSALSHIFPEIRIDACKLVSLLLEHVPTQVVGGWPRSTSASASSSRNTLDGGNNILEGLRLAVGLGGEKGMNAQLGKLGANGRLTTLKTLLAFVSRALGSEEDQDSCFDGWGIRTAKGKGKGKLVQVPMNDVSQEGWLICPGTWGLEDEDGQWAISNLDKGNSGDDIGTVEALTQLYLQLSPLLLSTFLEAAPTAFSPSSTFPSSIEVPISLCLTTASLTLTLTRPILNSLDAQNERSSERSEVRTAVSDFLRRMTTYFPFNSSGGASPTGITPSMQLNLTYANLAVLLAPSVPSISLPRSLRNQGAWRERVKVIEEAWQGMREVAGKSSGKSGKFGKSGASDIWALGEVSEWIIETLAPNKDVLAPALTPNTYSSLLPILWSLLVLPPSPTRNTPEVDTPIAVGTALLSHLLRQGSVSTTRSIGDEFIMDLIATHEQRHPIFPFFLQVHSPVRPLIKQWVESVPKTLWELGNKDEVTTERLLRFLLEIGLRGARSFEAPFSLLGDTSFPGIASKISPFFHLVHPSKGPIPGPWTRLSADPVRKLGLDVAKVWLEWDTDGSLRRAVDLAVERKSQQWPVEYWRRS